MAGVTSKFGTGVEQIAEVSGRAAPLRRVELPAAAFDKLVRLLPRQQLLQPLIKRVR